MKQLLRTGMVSELEARRGESISLQMYLEAIAGKIDWIDVGETSGQRSQFRIITVIEWVRIDQKKTLNKKKKKGKETKKRKRIVQKEKSNRKRERVNRIWKRKMERKKEKIKTKTHLDTVIVAPPRS